MLRRFVIAWLSLAGLLCMQSGAWAQSVHVVESVPAANAVTSGASSEFLVRFDGPVDHVRSLFTIKRGSDVVETLHPRFKSAPDVLFARAPTLPPGQYTLHWTVETLEGTPAAQGEIPFTVAH